MTALHEAAQLAYVGGVQLLLRGMPKRHVRAALAAKDQARLEGGRGLLRRCRRRRRRC